MIVKQHR